MTVSKKGEDSLEQRENKETLWKGAPLLGWMGLPLETVCY